MRAYGMLVSLVACSWARVLRIRLRSIRSASLALVLSCQDKQMPAITFWNELLIDDRHASIT